MEAPKTASPTPFHQVPIGLVGLGERPGWWSDPGSKQTRGPGGSPEPPWASSSAPPHRAYGVLRVPACRPLSTPLAETTCFLPRSPEPFADKAQLAPKPAQAPCPERSALCLADFVSAFQVIPHS
jgi:hypothetical protein